MQNIHSLSVRLLSLCSEHFFFWLPVFPSVTHMPTFLWGSSQPFLQSQTMRLQKKGLHPGLMIHCWSHRPHSLAKLIQGTRFIFRDAVRLRDKSFSWLLCWRIKPEDKTHLEKEDVPITWFDHHVLTWWMSSIWIVSPEAFTASGLFCCRSQNIPFVLKPVST